MRWAIMRARMKRRIARWASGQDKEPMSAHIKGGLPGIDRNNKTITVGYSAGTERVRVFKSKDSLEEFLKQLAVAGEESLQFQSGTQNMTFDDAAAMATWMTAEARGFSTFYIYSGSYSLSTQDDLALIGVQAASLNASINSNPEFLPDQFLFQELVDTFEHATRLATRKEARTRPIPYVTYRNREAVDSQKSNHRNVIRASIITACATLGAAVIAGFMSGVL